MPSSLLVSGFDVHHLTLEDGDQVLMPPVPLPALENFTDALTRALDEPLAGPRLTQRVKPSSKVTVVIDDFSFPVPPSSTDPRAEMLRVVLDQLHRVARVPPKQVQVLVANGLSRKWRPTELAEWLGIKSTSLYDVRCHDAENLADLVRIADEPQGPIELNRAVVEADLVIYLCVVHQPLHAGLFGLVHGTTSYRTARWLHAPSAFGVDAQPLQPGSLWDQNHQKVVRALVAKVPVLQLSAVLTNDVWPPTVQQWLATDAGLSRPLSMWNALPQAVRHRAARVMRAMARPWAVLCGTPESVEPRAMEKFLRQHEVTAEGEADVLVFGLPDIGPWSVGTSQNPILAAQLGLGYVAQLCTRLPLVREGGALVLVNPLTVQWDKAHRAHEELYEKVLRLEREPEGIHERYEPWLAGRPEFVADYQKRFAFHGAHALLAWTQCAPMRRRLSRVVVAHGDPRACARMGFMGANNLTQALDKAREAVADANPRVRVLELPPPFFVRVT